MTWKSHRLILGLPILGFAAALVVFALIELDLPISQRFYDQETGMWPLEWVQPWFTFNLCGEVPGLFLGLGALFILLLSIGRPNLHPFRKIATFLFLGALIGPGLIVNSILKAHWGRPRPNSTKPFDGHYDYEPFLRIDPASSGSSFSSGHAAMGFFLMSIGLLFLAAGRKTAGRLILLGSLVLGFLIGFSRVTCGKHFTADVLTSGLIIWTVTIILFFRMKMHHSLQFQPKPPKPANTGVHIMRVLSPVLVLLIVAYATIRWPITTKDEIPLSTDLPADQTLHVHLNIEGRVVIESGPTLHLRAIGDGHGLANARLLTHTQSSGDTLTVTQTKDGYFTKLVPVTHLILPAGRNYTVTLSPDIHDYDTRRYHHDPGTLTILRPHLEK